MPFTYNEKGVLAATDGNSQLYFTSRPTGRRTFIFIYEEEQFRVEFEVLVMSKPLLYRWRGQQRDGKRDSCAYIIEPTLRGAFYSAWRARSGSKPDPAEYQKFRERIVEGMMCIHTEHDAHSPQAKSPDFEFPPFEFSVKFVQKYDELPKN